MLPADQYRALAMAYFDGMNCTQIAEVVGVPITTVQQRLRAGLASLTTLLAASAET